MKIILLFTSDPDTIKLFQDIAMNSLQNCEIRAYTPDEQAVKACIDNPPSTILIDLHETGIHGVKLCNAIKDEKSLQGVPLLAISDRRSGETDQDDQDTSGLPDLFLYNPLVRTDCTALLKLCLRLNTLQQLVSSDHQAISLKIENKEAELEKFMIESKRAEELLRIERDFANQVLNAMGQGLTITNSDGFFIYINPAYSRLIGYSTEDLLGSRPQDVTFEDDISTLNIARQARIKGLSSSYETRIVHKNGALINVMITGVPYYKAGAVAGTIAVITDVSDLKKTEKRLFQLSEEYEQILNGTQAAMFLIKVFGNNTFRYILNNQAHQQTTGISLETLAGKTPEQLLGKEVGRVIGRNYARCALNKQLITYEEVLILPAGKKTWLTSLSPVIKDGHVTHIVGSSFDISQWKKPDTV